MIFGSMGAFWLADIVNPGFNPVGIMILLLIPVLVIDLLYPQRELEQLVALIDPQPIEEDEPETKISGDLVDPQASAKEAA